MYVLGVCKVGKAEGGRKAPKPIKRQTKDGGVSWGGRWSTITALIKVRVVNLVVN